MYILYGLRNLYVPEGPSSTSANLKHYTGLKLASKSHFSGRAAADEVLAGFLSALLRPRSGRSEFWLLVSSTCVSKTETSGRALTAARSTSCVTCFLRDTVASHAARGAAHGCLNGSRHAFRRRAARWSSVTGHRSGRSSVRACFPPSRRRRSQPVTASASTHIQQQACQTN